MRNMLALFAAALLTVVGVGWYLGWYKLGSQPASVPGHHQIKIDIDTPKIAEDVRKGEQKLETFLQKQTDNAQKTGDGLTLPSMSSNSKSADSGSPLQIKTGSQAPLFQFQREGPTIQVGDPNHPLLRIGGDKK